MDDSGASAGAMSFRSIAVLLAAVTLACLFAFAYVLRQLSFHSVGLAAHGEIETKLRQSLDDQKELARAHPEKQSVYHRRFDDTQELLTHLQVLALNRAEIRAQVETVLVAVVAFILVCGAVMYLAERRSREQRLRRLELALEALSRGDAGIELGERRRDVIGRNAAAVENSSRVAAQNRQRLRYLEHLSSWQEAARRHAHEIRTPLTAAQMEVERLVGAVRRRLAGGDEEIDQARTSILEELDHLREFTKSFTSFAMIASPRLQPLDIARLVQEFSSTFASAWPDMKLIAEPAAGNCVAEADSEMLRQVLVNLCNNSALSGAHTVRLSARREGTQILVDVSDDGPGVASEIRGRLFEPYTTTRRIGEGMGLGLAISKKIMIDHGGDLELVESERGATFRLTLTSVRA
jgi:signal transduction histidine kinase